MKFGHGQFGVNNSATAGYQGMRIIDAPPSLAAVNTIAL